MIQTIYISSPENQQIYIWKLHPDQEKLELMQIINTTGCAQPIAIHPNNQFLYVGIRPNFGIATYYINKEGFLSNKTTITKINNSPTYLSTNVSGSFLYCASYNYNTINVIPIDQSGIPQYPTQIIPNLLGCHSLNIDKNNKLLWAACLLENSIRLFSINMHNGSLIPYFQKKIIIHNNAGPRHIIFHPLQYYAYVINELNGTINVITYDKTESTLEIVQTINILPNNYVHRFWSSDIHITPNGRWLYCSDRAIHIISYFAISKKTGKLKFIDYQHTETQPRGFAIDCTGSFLIVAGQKSHCIALYSIVANTGKLNIIKRYQSGKGPMWISIISTQCVT